MTAPEDNLPPVEPPSAGFLMQLFVVPMVIVVVIVMVCLMFNWLAHLGSQPQDLAADLAKLNAGSWQKALTIANMLTDRRNSELRQDPLMAQQLADVLSREIEDSDLSPERIKLRMYLCTALGVFEVDEGLPELIEAAKVQREPSEIEVRISALEAIARRADVSKEQQASFAENGPLMDSLEEAASQIAGQSTEREANAKLRIRAAYALGVIGGREANDTLARLLSDPEPTVRYNAATGLARHGDDRAIPRLVEMLQLVSLAESIDDFTATTVIQNALRATVQLSAANPAADLTPVRQAIAQLRSDPQLSDTMRRGLQLDLKAADEQLNEPAAMFRGPSPDPWAHAV